MPLKRSDREALERQQQQATTPPATWTFLQFVIERLMGPPEEDKGDGKAIWQCPRCGKPLFSTCPHIEGMKDRWSCFHCNTPPKEFRGDEADILLRFYPTMRDYSERRCKLDQWQREYLALFPKAPSTEGAVSRARISPRGTGGSNADANIAYLRLSDTFLKEPVKQKRSPFGFLRTASARRSRLFLLAWVTRYR